jgi:acetyl-CoA synthetase
MNRIQSFEEYKNTYQKSVEDPETFWATIAENFVWKKKWDKVLEYDFHKPEVKWFQGAKLNITENCLDRHIAEKGNQTALIWEPNNPKDESKKFTYNALLENVCRVANMLKAQGLKKGDRVCIYMPMIPELAFAVLACARIGAVHSVVFAGFSSGSLVDRINDSGCRLILTTDGGNRGDKKLDLKKIVDGALEKCPTIEKSIIFKHVDIPVTMKPGRDLWWHDEIKKVDATCPAEEMDAEDLLFILYTSGSTGKPKGMVHTTAGYMVYINYTFQTAFQYKPGQIYWCTADIGWITGHSYILYAPLSAGATTVMFEGIPSWPDMGRFWQVIERHKVNIFYTAPTAIRSLEQASLSFVERSDLSSLHVLGSVGEPINEEAWEWYS